VAQWTERSTAQLLAALKPLLARRLSGDLGTACRAALQDRYPLQRRAQQEATRDGFAAAFGGGGLFDEFFQRHLAAYVDTSTRPWRAVGAPEAWAPELLAPFERAHAVREAFLAPGGKRVETRLELRLLAADPEVQALVLDLDGKPLQLRRDNSASVQTLRWPGDGAGRLRVAMALAGGGGPAYVFEGPWSLLRLLDRVRVEPGGTAERNVLVFDLEGRKARVEARSATPLNAVRRDALEQFTCPR
jgi:type VI secretion system protein ImpL